MSSQETPIGATQGPKSQPSDPLRRAVLAPIKKESIEQATSMASPKDSVAPLRKRQVAMETGMANHASTRSLSTKGQTQVDQPKAYHDGVPQAKRLLARPAAYNGNPHKPSQSQILAEWSTSLSNRPRENQPEPHFPSPDNDQENIIPRKVFDRVPVLRPKEKWSRCPTNKDVICTKHRTSKKHPGNQYYQHLIKEHVEILARRSNPLIFDKVSGPQTLRLG